MAYRVRLIDWMVVTGVVGIAAGLFVSSGRHSNCSRRAECQNNLRNVGLAMLGYANANGHLPAAALTDVDGRPVASVFASVSMFFDYAGLYNAYNFSVPSWHPANARIVSTRLGVLTCPDNPNRDAFPAGSGFAPCHYAVNWGGGRNGYGTDFVAKCGNDRGVMGEGWGVPLAKIPDGASTTLMAGEKLRGPGWAVGGWAASMFDAGTGPSDPRNGFPAGSVYAGSYHDGGANFAFCDGTVRYLASKTDPKVWYALITRDGHEAATLP